MPQPRPADEAKEKPAARGGARRGPKRTRARHARRWNGARGQQEVRRSYLTGTASGATYGAAIRLAQSPPPVRHGRAWVRTPRNRTRRDCRDDQQHDRREDLGEGPRAAAGLTERESFFEKQA